MAILFANPRYTPVDAQGDPYPGATLTFYAAGTTTPQAVYTTSALTTPHPSPVTANSAGQFPAIYYDDALQYRAILRDATGVLLWDIDTINSSLTAEEVGRALYTRTTGEISASVTPTAYRYPPGDVRRYGAVGNGTTDDTAALQAALSSNDRVIFPVVSTYRITAALNLRSNLTVDFAAGAVIQLGTGITGEYMLRGATVNNVRIIGATITGNGLAGLSAVYLTDSNDILFDRCKITRAGSMGILLSNCDRVTVRDCNLSNNYFYGVEDRDGVGNKYVNNYCDTNGNTTVASSTGGRGINLWRTVDTLVSGNSFVNSTEYGFRLYSQTGDATAIKGARVIGNYFSNNAACDIVVYNEAGTLTRHLFADNIIESAVNPSLGGHVVIQGSNVTCSNTHLYRTGTMGTGFGFQLFQTTHCSIVDCSAENISAALAISTATNCVIDGFIGDSVATAAGAAGIVGTGVTLRNCRFYHGGAGTTDVALANYNATGKNYIENNLFSGFDVGVYIGSEAVSLRDNTTVGSTTAGMRKDDDAQVGQEIIGNVWDSTNPALIQYLERRAAGNAVLYATAAPTIRTWAVGDRCYNSAPTAGQPKSWVCTTAGTPGTWTSEGNL